MDAKWILDDCLLDFEIDKTLLHCNRVLQRKGYGAKND